MSDHILEWVQLVFRWAHVISAITWIGHALFFNWLDSSLEESEEPGVEGDLWMVHSGGFYEVKKKFEAPKRVRDRLHWFKWEAMATMVTGLCLLGLVYYMGSNLVDQGGPLTKGWATLVGFGAIVACWKIYDSIWASGLGLNSPNIAAVVSAMLFVPVIIGLSHLLSGRGAYIHVGAIMGVCMVLNVWMRIIPAQKELLRTMREGGKPNPLLGERAKQRSVHNNYMTFPIIFIMVSNHYYSTYSGAWNWVILIALMVGSASVRHAMNRKQKHKGFSVPLASLVLLAAIAAVTLSGLQTGRIGGGDGGGDDGGEIDGDGEGDGGGAPVIKKHGVDIDPATTGSVKVTVSFSGTAPELEKLQMASGCDHSSTSYQEDVVVAGNRLANAFVYVEQGLENYNVPAPPSEPVEINQKGCIYEPRVTGVVVRQPLKINNDDPIAHNVHMNAKANRGFNSSMLKDGKPIVRRFRKPEIMLHFKCDIHPWMTSYIGVVEHPFFGTTDKSGELTIDGLPPGDYVLEAWHEKLGTKTVKVSVPEKAEASVEVTY